MTLNDLEWPFGLHFYRWQYMRSSANFRTVFSESQNANPLDAGLTLPGDIIVIELFTGVPEQEALNQCTVFTLTVTVTVLTHIVHCH